MPGGPLGSLSFRQLQFICVEWHSTSVHQNYLNPTTRSYSAKSRFYGTLFLEDVTGLERRGNATIGGMSPDSVADYRRRCMEASQESFLEQVLVLYERLYYMAENRNNTTLNRCQGVPTKINYTGLDNSPKGLWTHLIARKNFKNFPNPPKREFCKIRLRGLRYILGAGYP
ncbi:hypothetical protein C8J57DRAFT_1240999 [Mycena rebaudengoi]|nr:hypothetical protein C8J57DRAFT_1240999 [Mycena rebaudengoi]